MKFFSSVRFAIGGFVLCTIALFLYTFTQIDLSLAFSGNPVLQSLQKSFQYVGYFNRPLSAQLFLGIIILLTVFYIRILDLIRKKKLKLKQVILLIGIVIVFLTLTYNAFSYDLFNYIFDAKIMTAYHENPYLKKALDYPSDPMLSFMRWTHRTYPYGPVWLGLTVPLSYAGMQIFALTFGLFKLLATVSFGISCFCIYRILKHVKPDFALLGMTFFALNPLVLVESLVSAHNDIVMLCLTLISILFLVKKRIVLALLFLSLSIGLKFATVFLLPVFIYVIYQYYKKRTVAWNTTIVWMMLAMAGAIIAATLRTNFQPWYLLYILPFAALVSDKRYIFSPFIFLSIAALFNYLPFLYMGNWDNPIPLMLNSLNTTAVVVACSMLLLLLKQERKNS